MALAWRAPTPLLHTADRLLPRDALHNTRQCGRVVTWLGHGDAERGRLPGHSGIGQAGAALSDIQAAGGPTRSISGGFIDEASELIVMHA